MGNAESEMATDCKSEEIQEIESLVTCSVCLCEYDADVRKPKFLPCAHTLCLECLKVNVLNYSSVNKTTCANCVHYQAIHRNFVITCPLCRKVFPHKENVSSLPNNPYALHMLKSSEAAANLRYFHKLFLCPPHQHKICVFYYLGNQLHNGALPVR